jgi:hypothetical protein
MEIRDIIGKGDADGVLHHLVEWPKYELKKSCVAGTGAWVGELRLTSELPITRLEVAGRAEALHI